jgi:hypothetical protein
MKAINRPRMRMLRYRRGFSPALRKESMNAVPASPSASPEAHAEAFIPM